MNTEIQKFIDMLIRREAGMKENIKKALDRGNNMDRIHYIGWLRGIQGTRLDMQYFFKEKE